MNTTEAVDEEEETVGVNKTNRPRWSHARQGFPEPSVVVPHDGSLNRAQRRSQGRRGAFLKSVRTIHTAPMLVRRSGAGRWTSKERAKLIELAERQAV